MTVPIRDEYQTHCTGPRSQKVTAQASGALIRTTRSRDSQSSGEPRPRPCRLRPVRMETPMKG